MLIQDLEMRSGAFDACMAEVRAKAEMASFGYFVGKQDKASAPATAPAADP